MASAARDRNLRRLIGIPPAGGVVVVLPSWRSAHGVRTRQSADHQGRGMARTSLPFAFAFAFTLCPAAKTRPGPKVPRRPRNGYFTQTVADPSLSFLAMKIIFGVCAGGTWFSVGRLYYLTGVQRVGAYWWMWKRSARVDWASVISVIMRRAVGRPLVPSW